MKAIASAKDSIKRAVSDEALAGCFWPAAVGLALESCAGQFGKLITSSYVQSLAGEVVVLGHVVCLAIAFAVFFLAGKRRERFLFGSRVWAVLVCAGFTLGLVCYFSDYIFQASVPFLPVAGYLLAVIIGYLYLFVWFERVFSFGLKNTLLIVGASLVIRAVLQLLLLFLQDIPSICLLTLLPIASLPFFLAVFDKTSDMDPSRSYDPARSSNICSASSIRHSTAAMVALFAVIAFLVMLGLMTESWPTRADVLTQQPFQSHLLSVAANIIAGIAIVFFALSRMSRPMLFMFVLITAFLSCFSVFASSVTADGAQVVYDLASQLSVRLLDALAVIVAFVFSKTGGARYRLYVASRAVHRTAVLVAMGVVALKGDAFFDFHVIVQSIAFVGLFAALIVLFVCLETPVASEVAEEIEADRAVRRKPFKEAVDSIARQARLTSAEQHVFELIARGQNAESVRQELVISINTAKTHMRNIYAKLGVHSQQELIALVNETIESSRES